MHLDWGPLRPYRYIYIYAHFFGQNDVPGICMPCVCGFSCIFMVFIYFHGFSCIFMYPPPLQAMNHIMEYSRIYKYIVILWWHGQSQLKLDISNPDHKDSRIHLWMVAWCGLLTCRRRIFSAKMSILGFLRHVIALLRSSYVPQAPFFRQKWRSWDFYDM